MTSDLMTGPCLGTGWGPHVVREAMTSTKSTHHIDRVLALGGDHVLGLDERQKPGHFLAHRRSTTEHRPHRGRREPESRLDAQGLGRHTALTAMVFADVDTTVGLTNRRFDSGASV